MKKSYVYMITRIDGLKYIGMTLHPNKRLREHKKTKRFEMGIDGFEILFETHSYEECEKMEEHFISLHDTYHNGLNTTYDGKGKINNNTELPKYNTLGFKFSDESRQKMSENKKGKYLGSNNPNFGRVYKPEELEKMSKAKKGKMWITDGVETKLYDPTLEIPEGWKKGKTQNIDRNMIREMRKDKIFITNGKDCFSIPKNDFRLWEAKGYERGRIMKNINLVRGDETKKVSIFEYQQHLDDGWLRVVDRDRLSQRDARREKLNLKEP